MPVPPSLLEGAAYLAAFIFAPRYLKSASIMHGDGMLPNYNAPEFYQQLSGRAVALRNRSVLRHVNGKLSCGKLACKKHCTPKGIHIPLSSMGILYCACQA
jgi:hypothetical protein